MQRLGTLRTIGVRGIKTWRSFGAPSHFWSGRPGVYLFILTMLLACSVGVVVER